MIKVNTKLAAAAMLSAALLAGCGGGDGGGGGVAGGGGGAINPSASASAVVDYIQSVIAVGENTEPIDINSVTLATDETSEPVPFV